MAVWKRLRYRFDNLMSRGVGAQILLLAAFTALIVVVAVVGIIVCDVVPADDKGVHDSFGMLAWKSLMHALDPGTLAGDTAGWAFLFIMLFVTIGGLFVLSALIGVLNQGFGAMLERLRRGRSHVLERDHTVILGWGGNIHTLLHELATANRNQRRACVVILADRDKVEMDTDIAAELTHEHLRVVTRSGNPMSLSDLERIALESSKSVIVVAPSHHEDCTAMDVTDADTVVLKTLLAIARVTPIEKLHVVAELHDERTEAVARMVVGSHAALILAGPLISRLLVQTGRQSGLSVVYTELLDFDGCEIYIQPQRGLTGKAFRDAVFAYGTSTLIGVLTGEDKLLLPPELDRPFESSDRVIVISEDDDTVKLDGESPQVDDAKLAPPPPLSSRRPERTLVLGTSPRLPAVLTQLDAHVSAGSETIVVGESASSEELGGVLAKLANMRVNTIAGDVNSRNQLDALEITSFDHVLVLSETEARTQEMADARTIVTLLHLRDIERRAGKKVQITSEILNLRNRDLATIAEADDFIVSNTLVSLMVSQVSENPHLVEVFDELFASGGYEIYLKPATNYVEPGSHLFGHICEAALRRSEIAIGYRLAKTAGQSPSFGVTINPPKRAKVELGSADKVVVLAQN